MNHVDAYRDPERVRNLARAIGDCVTRPWTVMEICGGQTHSIIRHGLDQLLPAEVELVHGPGCPVCVTSPRVIDRAVSIAFLPDTILCSFGDMLRVPGGELSLLAARARGADVRVVLSPLEALELAAANPQRQVVFLAVGFETTAPVVAMAARLALERGVENFSLLISHVLVPPAMEAILGARDNRIQGFLAAGHVCAVTGYEAYHAIASRHRTPVVVTGFEPVDILQGLLHCVRQLERGEYRAENQYRRAVRERGNDSALRVMAETFEVVDQDWRGLGSIPASGLALKGPYRVLDAARRFPAADQPPAPDNGCISGTILQGLAKPPQCSAFGTRCTPEHPLGATMVSSEGACAAYYQYRCAGHGR